MKHKSLIAALATAGGLFAMGSAHAIAPAAAAAAAALAGAAVGTAAAQPNPPAVAVVPSNPTVVLGGPPATVIQEVIPAPREGYSWQQGHYEVHDGITTWMPGHWVANEPVVIYEDD
ncbi:MAG TPA: hypothetical protein VFM98_04490 [Ramlibacter sp.]|uniref:hypothetical protein n=1 Tax=Ramlibacter sp. TaxID=1917967 RepID=UPI002D7F6742|nr:hypothetical protein [Ramlibacter sp.]HET8744836.1 hypothetical protein [Ramlibacter sp.]